MNLMEMLPTIVFVIMITFVYLVPIVAVIAVIMWLLRKLIRQGKIKTGVAVIALVCLLITGGGFFFAKTTSTSSQGLQFWIIYIEEPGVTGGEIQIAQDHTTKEIFGFGPLIVSDKNGNRYIPLTFDEEGVLVGSKEALPYAKEIDAAVGDLPGKGHLTGDSLDYLALKSVVDTKLTKHGELYSWKVAGMYILQWNIVTLFLLIYFLAQIYRIRKRNRIHSKHTEIRDL